MCGIAGIYGPTNDDGKHLSDDTLKRMGSVLRHRGPDNTGVLIRDTCGFVHTRLSLLDLSEAGNQPMVLGEYVLVYNGEIYNFLELREELLAQNVELHSTSDTEVLLHMLIRQGVQTTLKRIRGMYAFSFYDGQSKTLYLCRDRIGIKPLHWLERDGTLYWASEVKAIDQVTPIAPDPVYTLFALSSNIEISHNQSVFDGVNNVPPGCYLEKRPGYSPSICRYYDMIEDVDEARYRELDGMTLEAAAAELSRLLADSTRRMLIADAPMGIFLSGGIDSSLLTALAVQQKKDLPLFTANVLGRHSEYDDAKLVSEAMGLPLYDAKFKPEDMLTYWAETTYHYEVPVVRHTNSIPFSRVSKLARSHDVKAVLTGEGSDELFLGYPQLLTRRLDGLIKFPLNAIRSVYGLVPPLSRYLKITDEHNVFLFMDQLVGGFERNRMREEARNAHSFLSDKAFEEHYLSMQSMKEGIISLLLRNDRMGMLASIESRFPFLDEEVVRFGVNLPVKFKIGRSRRLHNIKHPFLIDKAVVRKVCEPILPARITHKQKLGFPMFGHRSLRVAPGFFQGGYVSDLLQMTSGAEDHMLRTQNRYFIGKLVSIDVFGRLFAQKQSPEAVTEQLKRYVTLEAS